MSEIKLLVFVLCEASLLLHAGRIFHAGIKYFPMTLIKYNRFPDKFREIRHSIAILDLY
jgi:hypothetical protein